MTPRLGFLYPGHAAEDDYPLMAGRLAGRRGVDAALWACISGTSYSGSRVPDDSGWRR